MSPSLRRMVLASANGTLGALILRLINAPLWVMLVVPALCGTLGYIAGLLEER